MSLWKSTTLQTFDLGKAFLSFWEALSLGETQPFRVVKCFLGNPRRRAQLDNGA